MMTAAESLNVCIGALIIFAFFLAFVAIIALSSRRGSNGGGTTARGSGFRILYIGPGFVEFYHSEGGSFGYGMTADLGWVHGIERVISLGRRRYRMYLNRNAENAAMVLEAAFLFRTEPKKVRNGVVYLNECPGYTTLQREMDRKLR